MFMNVRIKYWQMNTSIAEALILYQRNLTDVCLSVLHRETFNPDYHVVHFPERVQTDIQTLYDGQAAF